ncbi:ABC transporter permease subunit [Arthrobacter sp. NPDC080031]|uniref:ABC transporter permease n=1 Tax=Arthrobacter sp. NPDC080031 TaxID=3155918 RepID=UPI00344BE436
MTERLRQPVPPFKAGPGAVPVAGTGVPGLASAGASRRWRSPEGRKTWSGRSAPVLAFWLAIVMVLILPIGAFLLAAFSPRLLGQGDEWFTLSAFSAAFKGTLLQALADSTALGLVAAAVAVGVSLALAWLVVRTDVPGRKIWTGAVFALLLTPSYLLSMGWQRLLEPSGVLAVAGIDCSWARDIYYGPVGIALILSIKGIPFGFLAISAAMRGLGSEFDDAVRVHGGTFIDSLRVTVSLLGPAVWAALAIVFAESVSDYGVASTLSSTSHFPVATYAIFDAVEAFPVRFPVAAAVSWMLLGLIAVALLLQSKALKGRSYRVLGGRSRPGRTLSLSRGWKAAAGGFLTFLILIALGVPAFGAVSASMIDGLGSLQSDHPLSLTNYDHALHSPNLLGPLVFSTQMALITATAAAVLALLCARMLTARSLTASAKVLDFILLAAIALPGIVFAAGYIFTYNLPVTAALNIHLYGTASLLVLAYVASALPSTTRLLAGSMSQLQESMREASRAHGSGPVWTWLSVVLPVLARPILSAWLLTFSGTILELPISQLLYPPGSAPVAVGINQALSTYDFGGGTAVEVLAVAFSLAVVGLASLIFRLATPAGWRKTGPQS